MPLGGATWASGQAWSPRTSVPAPPAVAGDRSAPEPVDNALGRAAAGLAVGLAATPRPRRRQARPAAPGRREAQRGWRRRLLLARAATTCRRRAWDGQRVAPVVPPARRGSRAGGHGRLRRCAGRRARGGAALRASASDRRGGAEAAGTTFGKGSRGWLRLHEKGGRRHDCSRDCGPP